MTQDEAEKLARELLKLHGDISTSASCLVCELCNYVLSGDMKREIENAAYRRAAVELDAYNYVHPAVVVLSLITPAKTADTEG